MKKNKFLFLIFVNLILIAFLMLPYFHLDRYYLRFFTMLFMWVALAECWNISSGYTGYIDFGPVGYFGIGAYATAIMMTQFKFTFFISIIFSGFIAGLIAFFIGTPTLRLKGAYFAIATFSFAESIKQIVLSFDSIFKVNFFYGSYGITLPICLNYKMFYFLMLFMGYFLVLITYFIDKSKFGLALKAINDSEIASEMIGINTTAIKLTAYTISGFFIGIIGGIYSYWITYITPNDVFNIHKTVQMIIMTLLGGMGSVVGPVIGATFLSVISEILGAEFVEDYLILVGIIIVLIVLIAPDGIIGIKKWKFSSKQKD